MRSFLWDRRCHRPPAAYPEVAGAEAPGGTGGPHTTPLFGLAPHGVCHAPDRRRPGGALLPHRFTLTAPRLAPRGGLLSVALSVASPRLAVSEHAARRSSDFPLRASRRGATAWSSPAVLILTDSAPARFLAPAGSPWRGLEAPAQPRQDALPGRPSPPPEPLEAGRRLAAAGLQAERRQVAPRPPPPAFPSRSWSWASKRWSAASFGCSRRAWRALSAACADQRGFFAWQLASRTSSPAAGQRPPTA